MKRRTEIIIETDRLLVVRKVRRAVAWCAPCSGFVSMVTTDEAAALARVTSRTIFRWVESGQVHYTETAAGLLLICPNSLPYPT